MQADLKKMAGPGSDDDEASAKASKKPKRTGPSLLQLEREKYLQKGAASTRGGSKGKKGRVEEDLTDALAGFKSKLIDAVANAPEEEVAVEAVDGYAGEVDDDDDENDAGWLSHALVFRKDATQDRRACSPFRSSAGLTLFAQIRSTSTPPTILSARTPSRSTSSRPRPTTRRGNTRRKDEVARRTVAEEVAVVEEEEEGEVLEEAGEGVGGMEEEGTAALVDEEGRIVEEASENDATGRRFKGTGRRTGWRGIHWRSR